MNEKIKYEMYEMLELISRLFRLRDEGNEHYLVCMNLLYHRCRDYVELVNELDALNVGEEE